MQSRSKIECYYTFVYNNPKITDSKTKVRYRMK